MLKSHRKGECSLRKTAKLLVTLTRQSVVEIGFKHSLRISGAYCLFVRPVVDVRIANCLPERNEDLSTKQADGLTLLFGNSAFELTTHLVKGASHSCPRFFTSAHYAPALAGFEAAPCGR